MIFIDYMSVEVLRFKCSVMTVITEVCVLVGGALRRPPLTDVIKLGD